MSFGTFPAASKILHQKEKDRAYSLHRQRMYNVKSQIDNSPPRQHAHLLLRLKQLQTEEEKKAKIDRENKILLRKMTHIMLSREHKRRKEQPDMKGSLNQDFRDRIRDRINAENIQIAQRIQKTRPIYDVDKWENDYKSKQKLMDMWSKSTKDYQSPRAQKDDEYNYESDFESEDERKRGDKLPPISKRNMNRDNESDRMREGRQEHSSPDRDLYMYYGLKKPAKDSHSYDNENGDDAEQKHGKGQKGAGDDKTGDAGQLFKVAKELIPPHDAFIKCLAKKTHKQRMAIADDFQEKYDLELKGELKKGLGHEWFTLIDALLKKPGADEGAEKTDLTKGLNVSDAVSLTKKLSALSNQEMADVKEQYLKENSNSLEAEISKRHADPVERFLLTLTKGGNDENNDVDEKTAEKDAQSLMDFGEGRWTSPNGKFLLLLETKSPEHIRSVLAHYKTKNKGKTVEEAIRKECPEDYAEVIITYINTSEESADQELETLHKNLDSRNPEFVELVVAKSEVGMAGTNKAYKSRYGKDLSTALQSNGDHTTSSVLVALINKKPAKKGSKANKAKGKSDGDGGKKTTGRQGESKRDGKTGGGGGGGGGSDGTRTRTDSKHKGVRRPQGGGAQRGDDKTKQSEGGKGETDDKNKDDKDDDVKTLHDAMDGLGTNEDVIIDIIVNTKNEERQKMRKEYKERYKNDLIGDLKSELSGDFEEVVLALMMSPLEYDAYCLHESMAGAGTDETILFGILCSKKQAHLNDLKKQYKKDYKTDLESNIRGDTSGDVEDLLVKIISGERDQSKDVDRGKAEADAKILHEDPSSKALKEILVNSSRSQLKATEDTYKKMYNEEMTDAIDRASSGDAEDAFVAIVKANRDLVLFYTSRAHSAVKGLGTNDTQLIRILVSRSEIDLPAIKAKYKELYGTTLRQDVADDTSGDYKNTLLKIIDKC